MLSLQHLPILLAGSAMTLALSVQPEPPRCIVFQNLGRCVVEAAEPGRVTADVDPEPGSTAGAPASEDSGPPPFVSRPIPELLGGGPGQPVLLAPEDAVQAELEAQAPEAGADVLALRAIEALDLPAPAPHVSALERAYVGVPIWAWIDATPDVTGPVEATAVAGGSVVTATATLSQVRWSMGPPGDVVECVGPGTPWTGQEGESPDCGYTYTQRSLPERTGGSGRWPVTTTAVYTVVWGGVSGGAPVDGVEIVELSTDQELAVGELQVLTVGGGS